MNPNPNPNPNPIPASFKNQETALHVPLHDDKERPYKTDLDPEEGDIVLKAISKALLKHNELKDIAVNIKEYVGGKLGGKWSCILGKDFSSSVDHLGGHYLYTYMDEYNIGVLVFKSLI